VILPDPLLKVYVAEKPTAKSHRRRASSPPCPTPRDTNGQILPPFFRALLVFM
jgi:hypothetical protein